MITKSKWIGIVRSICNEMKSKGTIYGWKSPVNEANTLKKSTCVGLPSLSLQRAGLLPSGKYIHLDNGKLAGTGLSYIKAHPEIYTIIWAKATPQTLGDKLHEGDICLYTVPHIQVYAGKNKSGSPIWYSLERGPGGMGKTAKITNAAVFGYYTKRKIECIIRLKFSPEENSAKPSPTPTPEPAKQIKYKTKMAMNVRREPNSSSKKLTTMPKGITFIPQKVNGSWAYASHGGIKGWICILPKYCTKL